jgi:hypothetical protein
VVSAPATKRKTTRLPAHTVDLPTRVMADLVNAGELGSARADLALVLATFVVDDMRADGPRVAAAKQLADILREIGQAGKDTGDGIDKILADRKRSASVAKTTLSDLMGGST